MFKKFLLYYYFIKIKNWYKLTQKQYQYDLAFSWQAGKYYGNTPSKTFYCNPEINQAKFRIFEP